MLTVAYGEATLVRSNVHRWYKMFSEDREAVNYEERAGRPSTSTTDENIDEVRKIVLVNRRIREVAEDRNISIRSCQKQHTSNTAALLYASEKISRLKFQLGMIGTTSTKTCKSGRRSIQMDRSSMAGLLLEYIEHV